MKTSNNAVTLSPANAPAGTSAIAAASSLRNWLAATALILALLLLAASSRAGTRLAIVVDDRGTCVRALPLVLGACSRLLPGTVTGYLPAGQSSRGTVLLSIPLMNRGWHWMRWDDPALPDGWVRSDVLQPSPD